MSFHSLCEGYFVLLHYHSCKMPSFIHLLEVLELCLSACMYMLQFNSISLFNFLSAQASFKFNVVFAAADGFVVQTGDPKGPAEGFIDPSTEKNRTIPLEIMVSGDKTPVYGETLEVRCYFYFE